MAFRVGQKVVCINDDWEELDGPEVVYPRKDAIYTVREVDAAPDETFLAFRELVNPPQDYNEGYLECHFAAINFRPIVERKTDTGFAILEEIRKRESVPADERVLASLHLNEGQADG